MGCGMGDELRSEFYIALEGDRKVRLTSDLDELGCTAKDEAGFRYTNAGGYNANVEDE